MTRTEIINTLIENNGYKSYLEIGLSNPELNFIGVQCEEKESVDPYDSGFYKTELSQQVLERYLNFLTYRMTSDDLFAQMPADKKYDFIFIDGLHEYKQVARDIINSLKHLNPNGLIMIHDAVPQNEEDTIYKEGEWIDGIYYGKRWLGNVYKTIVQLHKVVPVYYTIDEQPNEEVGITILKYFEGCENIVFEPEDVSYQYYEEHKNLLRIKPLEDVLFFFSKKKEKLFEIGHKPWKKNNCRFKQLQVGSNEAFLPFVETEGYNISSFNPYFAELTGIYWIWQNQSNSAEFVGQTTYRRHFMITDDFPISDVFKRGFDIILPNPLLLTNTTLEENYAEWHNGEDLRVLVECILETYPEYEDTINETLKQAYIFPGNGFIMKSEDYHKYCSFLFDIINKVLNKLEITNSSDLMSYLTKNFNEHKYLQWGMDEMAPCLRYQQRLIGFLSERLFNIYIKQNFKNIFIIPYSRFVY